jgi:hypothetical protein
MLQMGFDTFALVMNFLNREWVLCHVMIGLFKALDTSGAALAELVKPLLAKFKLTNKVIICVQNKGKNLATLNSSLSYVVSCGVFKLERHYEKSCLRRLDWHVTRLSRKLLCNLGTTTIWKYDELIIKMSHQNIS